MALSTIEKIRKELKSKFFWIAVAIAIPTSIGSVMGHENPELSYLQIPMAALIMGTLPALASTELSPRFALIFVWFHKNMVNFRNREHITYTVNGAYSEKPSYRNYALYNIWYTLGITFFIVSILPLNPSNITQLMVVTIGTVFLSIILSSGINFAIFLINKKGIFYENKKDGSHVNLGSDIKKLINSSLFSIQIFLFLYTLLTENTLIPLLISLGMSLLICFVASLTSYYVLKKHYIDKLYLRFDKKLKL